MYTFTFIQKLKTVLSLQTALLCLTTLTAFSQKPEIYVQTGHARGVYSVAFSSDGRTVVTGGEDCIFKLWDAISGQEKNTLKGGTACSSMALSPDGTTLATGGKDLIIRLWNLETGQVVAIIKGQNNFIISLAFSPDGKTLASGSIQNPIMLWDVASGRKIKTFAGQAEYVDSLAFSPDGKTLASGSNNPFKKTGSESMIKIWDVASGVELKTFRGHSKPVNSVAFSPNGRTLASGSDDKTIKLWDMASGRELKTFIGDSYGVSSVGFSPDGKTLASGSWDKTAKLWDVASGQELKTFSGHSDQVSSVGFSPDGKTLASGSWDKTAKLWEVTDGRELKTFRGHVSSPAKIAYSPNGRLLAISYGEPYRKADRIRVWDLALGRPVRTFEGGGPISFSPDGRTLASILGSKSIRLRDIASGMESVSLDGHTDDVISLAFSPDGKMLMSAGKDGTIKLWDVETRQVITTFSDLGKGFLLAAFSPDGKTAAIVSGYRTAQPGPNGLVRYGAVGGRRIDLVDLASGRRLRTLPGHFETVSITFSPDGKTLASVGAGEDPTPIKLWNVRSGLLLKTMQPASPFVFSVSFSPNSKTIATQCFAFCDAIELWNVESGRRLKSIQGGSNSVAFSPDGESVASDGGGGSVKLSNFSDGRDLARLTTLNDNDWVVVSPDGRFDGSSEGMKLISYKQDNKLIPLDSFFDKFFTPNLLQKVYAREALPPITAKVDFSKRIRLPPVVRITSPKPGAESNSDTAQITVEANDQGGGVEDIRLYQNGKLLDGATRQLVQNKKPNTRTFEVNLLPGVNTFRATAFNSDRTEAQPDEIKIELKAIEATANLYILAVGLNEYKNTRYNLNYGKADAQAFADAVELRGKGIFKHIKKNVIFDSDASHGGIKTAFDEIIKESRPQDVFVFFYAGHGTMSEGDQKNIADFYLVPHDVVNVFGESGNLFEKGISATDLRVILTKVRALKQLIVIDACQSGGAVDTIATRSGPAEEKAIMQLARSTGVVVLASAGQNQVATEFEKLGHGVFTYVLLKGLNGEADGAPKDGKVTVKELAAYVDDQVPGLAKLHRGQTQYPMSATRGHDFPIGIK